MAANRSMEAWIETFLDDRHCMDCKVPLAEGEGTMEFRGQLPHLDLVGHLCTPCWKRREAIRRVRQMQREGT